MRLHGERSLPIHGLRKRAAITAIVSAALLVTAVASFADASTTFTSRDPRVINRWNKIGVDLIVGTPTIGGTARAFNYFAYQQAAVYNAVQGITAPRLRPPQPRPLHTASSCTTSRAP